MRGCLADLAMARRRARRRARASRQGPRRGGRAGRPAAPAPRSPSRARRCSVIDDLDAARPDDLGAVRRAPARREAGPISSRVMPAASPAAAAARALWTACRPSAGMRRRRSPGRRQQAEAHALGPERLDVSARTSASRREAVGQATRARVRDPMRRTRGSSAFRTAVPSAGQRLDQLALGMLDRVERADPRRGGPPHRGDDPDRRPADRRQLAISPAVYMPISRTAASCSGPRPRTVSGRPISLFWLPSFLQGRERAAEDTSDGLLRRRLGDAPVTPTTSGSKRSRHAAAIACSAAQRVRRPDDGHVAEGVELRPSAGGSRHERARPRRRPTAAARNRWPSVRSPGRATNSWPGSRAGSRPRRRGSGRRAAGQEAPAGRAGRGPRRSATGVGASPFGERRRGRVGTDASVAHGDAVTGRRSPLARGRGVASGLRRGHGAGSTCDRRPGRLRSSRG